MTPSDHRDLRQRLGLTAGAEARLLGVSRRGVERWDSGAREIPPPVARLLRLLEIEHETGPVRVMAAMLAMGAK